MNYPERRPEQNCPKCKSRGRYTGLVLPSVNLSWNSPLPTAEFSCPNGHTFRGIGGLRLAA